MNLPDLAATRRSLADFDDITAANVNPTLLLKLAAMASICSEFRADDVRLFCTCLRYSRRPGERLRRLFRSFVRREAEFAYLLRSS